MSDDDNNDDVWIYDTVDEFVSEDTIEELSIEELREVKYMQLWSSLIPSSMVEVRGLEILGILDSRVDKLPNYIYDMTRLRSLCLVDTAITSLTTNTSKLTNLEELGINGRFGCSRSMVKRISLITSLTRLSITLHTPLNQSIGNLKNLESLTLTSRFRGDERMDCYTIRGQTYSSPLRTVSIPSTIGQLSNMKYCNMSFMKLTPDILLIMCNLIKLEVLSLSDCAITYLPQEIGQLTCLRKLKISSNRLQSIPDKLFKLPLLQSLVLKGNFISSLPDNIHELTEVTHLDFSSCHLTDIVPSIGSIPKLRILKLSHNRLRDLPLELGNIRNLESLDLGDNCFKHIPQCIYSLTSLKTLSMSYCRMIISIPPDIRNLKSLERLSMYGCNRISYLCLALLELRKLREVDIGRYTPLLIGPEFYSHPTLKLKGRNRLHCLNQKGISPVFNIRHLLDIMRHTNRIANGVLLYCDIKCVIGCVLRAAPLSGVISADNRL